VGLVARPLLPFTAFGAVSGLLSALHYALPRASVAQGLVYQAVGVLAVVAVVAGILLHRPSRIVHLVALAGGLALMATGDAIFNYYLFLTTEAPYPSAADAAYLAGYAGYALAAALLLRSRHRMRLGDLLDAAVVMIGASLLFWVLMIEPVAADGTSSLAARVTSSLYPAFDLLILVVLAQLLTTGGAANTAFRLFVAGVAMLLVPDVVYAVQSVEGTFVAGGVVDLGWMLSTTCWGLAALHPSVCETHLAAPVHEARLTWKRLALLGTASLVPAGLFLRHEQLDPVGVPMVGGAAAVTTVLVVARMAMLFHEHGRAVAALHAADARAEAEHALRDANERFESAAAALECAIYEWSRSSNTVRWTAGLGHPSQDRSGTWWADHVHPEDRERQLEQERRVHAGAPERESEYRFRRGDGTWAHVLDRWVVAYDEDGEVARVVGGMVDVTHQRALEARLQQSEKMEALGRLAGGVAHDFNNLLTAILGNTELLRDASPGDGEWAADVDEIERAAGRAAELTAQLLTFSRGRGAAVGSARLDETVGAMATMLGRLLGVGVQLQLDLEGDDAYVACDGSQLEQVVLNLALNARDAMPEGGTLRIETARSGGRARLVVSDTGVGMDEATAERIFEPFFTTKDPGKGTGLGLATVYGVVEQAGGTVAVRTAPGEGTSFELLLPLGEAPVAGDAPPTELHGRSGATILLVDDEAAVRSVTARMLERCGYHVVDAATPLDALALLEDETFEPDAVVTDVVMPQLSGFALAHRIEELRPGTSILFVTGYAGAERPEGLERHPILRKPFAAGELAAAVATLLEATAPQAA
jgi:signal transduction histidine kinase/CheY-like chemotaxis protein